MTPYLDLAAAWRAVDAANESGLEALLAEVLADIGARRPWLLHRAEGQPSESVPLAAELIRVLAAR